MIKIEQICQILMILMIEFNSFIEIFISAAGAQSLACG